MSKQAYEKLLADFRREWCKHRHAGIAIEIFAPSYVSKSSPPYDAKKYELLAQVALPFDVSCEITADGSNSTLIGWAVVEKDYETIEARKSLRQLCDQAGAALPPQFRNRLAGLCHWYMTEPATWWMALLVYLSGKSAYGADGSYQGHAMLLRPFLHCVHAIEICRLNTDNAVFPDRTPEQVGDFITKDHPDAHRYQDNGEWCTGAYAESAYTLKRNQLTKAHKKSLFGVTIEPPRTLKCDKGRDLQVFLSIDLKRLFEAADQGSSE